MVRPGVHESAIFENCALATEGRQPRYWNQLGAGLRGIRNMARSGMEACRIHPVSGRAHALLQPRRLRNGWQTTALDRAHRVVSGRRGDTREVQPSRRIYSKLEPSMSRDERFTELEEYISAGYGDTMQSKIPADWRTRPKRIQDEICT